MAESHKETKMTNLRMITPLERQIIAARQDCKILCRSLGFSEDEARAYAEDYAKDFAEGMRRCAESIALHMLREHEPLPWISKYTYLTKEELTKIAQAHHLTLNEG